MVRLEQEKQSWIDKLLINFNSIMVRLEHIYNNRAQNSTKFQFHYGAIGTRC